MANNVGANEFNRRSLSALLASMLGPGFGGVGTLAFPVFLTAIAAEFGGRGKVSALYTVAGLCSYAAMLGVGAAVDRFGVRKVAPLVTAFSAASVTALWVSKSFGFLGLVLIFAAIGVGNSTLAAYSKLNAGWFVKRRGIAFGLSAFGVGLIWMLIIPQTASALLRSLSWRASYGVMGVFTLVVGVPLIAYLVRDSDKANAAQVGALEGRTPVEAWRSVVFWLIIVGVCAETATFNSTRSQMVALLTDRGVSPAVAVSVLSTTLLGTMLGQPFAGWLVDRFATPKVILPFVVFSVAGMLLFSFGQTLVSWIAGNIIMSIGYAGELIMAPYFFTRFFGPKHHGKIYGSMFVCQAPVTALAPALMGEVFDKTGSYLPMLLGLSGALVIGGVCFALLPAYAFGSRTGLKPRPLVQASNVPT